ncbi:MAG: glutamyl-tRNA reductase [Holophagales bacterium]|nr:glutamyl-tRNA reductase [Holophagales bacterium]
MASEIVFVGWNHQGSDLDLRARLAFTPERAREALEGLFREHILTEGAVVSTCNRAEVYGVSDVPDSFEALSAFFSRFHSVDAAVLREKALSGRGEATVRHLFRVASGLDSMVLGEAQILGQIREAHRRAAEAGTARAVTGRLFQSALECGKKVRTETSLGSRPVSVAGIALSLVGRIFESISECKVLLLGAGETVELTARLLADDGVKQILFANRSPEKAKALATHFHGWTVPWEERAKAFADVDIVLSATGATEPVVTAAMLKPFLSRGRRRGPLLILDLAVPRDIETKVDDFSDVYRYDLDALGELACDNTRDRMADVPHAERIVEESTQKFLCWLAGLAHVDTLKSLHERFEKARCEEIERYAGKLSRLTAEDQAVVSRMTETLLQKILHNPTIGLKEGDASERLTRAAVVRALFKLDDRA